MGLRVVARDLGGNIIANVNLYAENAPRTSEDILRVCEEVAGEDRVDAHSLTSIMQGLLRYLQNEHLFVLTKPNIQFENTLGTDNITDEKKRVFHVRKNDDDEWKLASSVFHPQTIDDVIAVMTSKMDESQIWQVTKIDKKIQQVELKKHDDELQIHLSPSNYWILKNVIDFEVIIQETAEDPHFCVHVLDRAGQIEKALNGTFRSIKKQLKEIETRESPTPSTDSDQDDDSFDLQNFSEINSPFFRSRSAKRSSSSCSLLTLDEDSCETPPQGPNKRFKTLPQKIRLPETPRTIQTMRCNNEQRETLIIHLRKQRRVDEWVTVLCIEISQSNLPTSAYIQNIIKKMRSDLKKTGSGTRQNECRVDTILTFAHFLTTQPEFVSFSYSARRSPRSHRIDINVAQGGTLMCQYSK